jgi:cbb3-type cytochrome c oxidase subunit III
MHPVTPGDAGNPNLEFKVYGPSGKQIYMNGAPDQPNNPPHLWTGFCEQTCAATLRDMSNYVDLSGWGKIRWLTRQSGLNRIHTILKLADGRWIVSERGEFGGIDHLITEFSLSETRWIGLDIDKVVTRGLWLDKVDLTKVDEIGFTTLMPGSGQGYGGYADVGWFEVYGIPVPRSGESGGLPVISDAGDAESQRLRRQFGNKSVADLSKDLTARATARTLYMTHCAGCHGPQGKGSKATGTPDLTAGHWQWGMTPENVMASIAKGIGANMPSWLDVIGPGGVEDVLAYTLTLSGNTQSAGDPVRGKEIFNTTCASCHGYQGKGDPRVGASDLTDDVWQYGGSVEAVRDSIAKGRKGVMPALGVPLGATRVNLLAAYVLGLSEATQRR